MIVVIDFETTGLTVRGAAFDDPRQPWPVSVAALLIDDAGEERAMLYTLIRPEGWTVPAEASRIHGITDADAMARGMRLSDAFGLLTFMIERADAVVCHNVEYDGSIYASTVARCPFLHTAAVRPTICTMFASVDLVGIPSRTHAGQNKYPRLTELHAHLFGEPMQGAHNALVDARATARCYLELKRRGVIA